MNAFNKKIIAVSGAVCLSFCAAFTAFAQEDGSYEQFIAEGYTYDEIREAEQSAAASADISAQKSYMTSTSRVDWSRATFTSDVTLDVVKAGIPMPSGKSVSMNRIQMELPVLVKDPLLSLYADDTRTIGDLILEGSLTLDALTRIIDDSKKTPPYFVDASNKLKTTHTISLSDIGSLLVRHHTPYVQEKPIDRISSRAYTGIVIDARGTLPVQGEHIKSEVSPCLFPKIWNEDMTLVYERNMVNPEVAKKSGIVDYLPGQGSNKKTQRAGSDPLWITARKVYGVNRCDPVISYEDYLRITTVPQNLELLKQGKVVILLDASELSHGVTSPRKDVRYWLTFTSLKKYMEDPGIPETEIDERHEGYYFTMDNLRFIADSAELLPQEKPRISEIATQLKAMLAKGDYTIRINGHTADVNKPNGQQTLSLQRAEAIVNALAAEGISKDLFTWYGYGGTMPVADNNTAQGRAQNRRVEIVVMPRGTEIQYR
ncbi:MAG TPA: OmpA family protein [Treponema sp.]|nr:OmpA family protein [Treponema sp.]HBB42752.1 OmpA family protein [Treponema sp.]